MITTPLIVCIVGLLIYILGSESNFRAWVVEVGRLMFMIGLFWTLYGYAGKVAF